MAQVRTLSGKTVISNSRIEVLSDLVRIAVREGVDLREADFSNWDLSGMNLVDLDFTKASFAGADLHGANMMRGNFQKADFTNADLRGCDFSTSDLRGAIFIGAKIDAETSFKDILYWGSEFEGTDIEKSAAV